MRYVILLDPCALSVSELQVIRNIMDLKVPSLTEMYRHGKYR
jgi:hypothetical protein